MTTFTVNVPTVFALSIPAAALVACALLVTVDREMRPVTHHTGARADGCVMFCENTAPPVSFDDYTCVIDCEGRAYRQPPPDPCVMFCEGDR